MKILPTQDKAIIEHIISWEVKLISIKPSDQPFKYLFKFHCRNHTNILLFPTPWIPYLTPWNQRVYTPRIDWHKIDILRTLFYFLKILFQQPGIFQQPLLFLFLRLSVSHAHWFRKAQKHLLIYAHHAYKIPGTIYQRLYRPLSLLKAEGTIVHAFQFLTKFLRHLFRILNIFNRHCFHIHFSGQQWIPLFQHCSCLFSWSPPKRQRTVIGNIIICCKESTKSQWNIMLISHWLHLVIAILTKWTDISPFFHQCLFQHIAVISWSEQFRFSVRITLSESNSWTSCRRLEFLQMRHILIHIRITFYLPRPEYIIRLRLTHIIFICPHQMDFRFYVLWCTNFFQSLFHIRKGAIIPGNVNNL